MRIGRYEYYISTVTNSHPIDAEVFEAAGRFGTAIHEAAPLAYSGELDFDALGDYRPPVEQFMEWVKDYNVKDAEFEIRVFSKKNWYAGTLDIMSTVNGERGLTDIKTGMSTLVGPQTSAYEKAYREERKDRKKMKRYVLELPRDGSKYKFRELTDRDDEIFFLQRRFQHNYLTEGKGIKL